MIKSDCLANYSLCWIAIKMAVQRWRTLKKSGLICVKVSCQFKRYTVVKLEMS